MLVDQIQKRTKDSPIHIVGFGRDEGEMEACQYSVWIKGHIVRKRSMGHFLAFADILVVDYQVENGCLPSVIDDGPQRVDGKRIVKVAFRRQSPQW